MIPCLMQTETVQANTLQCSKIKPHYHNGMLSFNHIPTNSKSHNVLAVRVFYGRQTTPWQLIA